MGLVLVMDVRRVLTSVGAVLFAVVALAGGPAQAQDCQPAQDAEYAQNQETYDVLINALGPVLPTLTADLSVLSAENYGTLLANAQALASSVAGGRAVVTLPDGTVVVDTGKSNNTYEDFQNKTINENHNSRLAILAAQEYPCGTGLERKLSTSTGSFESAVAMRLGDHLSSAGTVRLSN